MDSFHAHINMRHIVTIMCLIFNIIPTEADLIGYDCEDENTELSRVSLLKVKSCLDPHNDSTTDGRFVQLIQEKHYAHVHVYSCLVSVEQIIQYCGMHSHVSAVAGGFGRYVHYLRSEKCIEAHRFRRIDLSGLGIGIVSDINCNGTTEVSATLHGHIDNDGNCQGIKYIANGHTYTNAIVSAAVTIKLFDYNALSNVEENKINLRSGTICDYTSGYCFDDSVGEVTWIAHELVKCSTNSFDVLYEGHANILTLKSSDNISAQQFVIVESNDIVFALKLIKQEIICNQYAWRTEQSRILVIYHTNIGFYFQKSRKIAHNIDLMTQVLSKLLFMEIAVKSQMRDLIYDSIYKRCQLRQKLLENRLALALESPDVISTLIKGSPGYVGRIMGETLFIAKCSAKIVKIRRAEYCYQELPISYKNESKFLTPVTHIIQNHGTEVDCYDKLPPIFKLSGEWVEITPVVQRARIQPVELDPNVEETKLHMMRISPISSHDGLYTKQEMQEFQKNLLFNTEKRAVTNLVTRRVIDSTADSQGYYIPKIFSGNELIEFAQTTAERAWGFLSKMGNYFSVFALLYTLWNILCYIASLILNFFSLKKIVNQTNRPRMYFFACLWQALTNRLLYNWILNQKQEPQTQTQIEVHHDNVIVENSGRQTPVAEITVQHNPVATQLPITNNPINIFQQPPLYPNLNM